MKQNVTKIVEDLGKTVVSKGEERFVKESAGTAYEIGVESIEKAAPEIMKNLPNLVT